MQQPDRFVVSSGADAFIQSFDNESVDLFLIDPPYYGVVGDEWDNQWWVVMKTSSSGCVTMLMRQSRNC